VHLLISSDRTCFIGVESSATARVLKEYFGTWTPASTTTCINQLLTPGARIELDMIAAYPPGK
jgi:enamine deaminase RidA (YjgF/YER057c/UK114 family)